MLIQIFQDILNILFCINKIWISIILAMYLFFYSHCNNLFNMGVNAEKDKYSR